MIGLETAAMLLMALIPSLAVESPFDVDFSSLIPTHCALRQNIMRQDVGSQTRSVLLWNMSNLPLGDPGNGVTTHPTPSNPALSHSDTSVPILNQGGLYKASLRVHI